MPVPHDCDVVRLRLESADRDRGLLRRQRVNPQHVERRTVVTAGNRGHRTPIEGASRRGRGLGRSSYIDWLRHSANVHNHPFLLIRLRSPVHGKPHFGTGTPNSSRNSAKNLMYPGIPKRIDSRAASHQQSSQPYIMEPSLETRTILHTADATTARQADRLFQLAVESAPHAILMWDAERRILLANPANRKICSATAGASCSASPWKFCCRVDAWSACSPGVPSAVTTRELGGRRKDGSRFPVEIVLNPIQTGEGDWVVATVVDITERKRAEASLRESEERFRAIFSHAGVGLAQARLDGVLDFVNDRLCRMLGYSQSELLGKNVLDITHPDDRHLCTEVMSRLLTGELSSPSIEKRYLCKDGSACVDQAVSIAGTRSRRPAEVLHRPGRRYLRPGQRGARVAGQRDAPDAGPGRRPHRRLGLGPPYQRRDGIPGPT